jgi:hypothetical protein
MKRPLRCTSTSRAAFRSAGDGPPKLEAENAPVAHLRGHIDCLPFRHGRWYSVNPIVRRHRSTQTQNFNPLFKYGFSYHAAANRDGTAFADLKLNTK